MSKRGLILRVVHHTHNRARFAYVCPEGSVIQALILRVELEKLPHITSVRINDILHNIIITYSGSLEKLKQEIFAVLENLITLSDKKDSQESYLALRGEIPSSMEVVRSATALVSEPFLPSNTLKSVFSFIACAPILTSGIKEVFSQGITSRVLEAMAIAISLYRQDYRTANSTNFMLTLGEYIEEMSMYKSDDLLKELSKPQGGDAWVEKYIKGKAELVLTPSSQIQVGDIVVVGAGQTILIDGHIVSGEALVNQISMTGEATPVRRARGDRVLSGTIVQEGKIKIWAEGVGEQTATARIKEYIQTTLSQKSSIQLNASKMADKLVPITLGLGLASYVFSRDLTRVASVLQADYSCALKLATPVAFKSTISNAGKNGIIIKGAKSLETLNQAQVFVFDKTGTLTNGELEVVEVHSFDPAWHKDEILNLSASIEEHYFHPVAEAVVRAAKQQEFIHMHHEEVTFIVAHGVKSQINGKEVLIGNRHFLEDDEGVDMSAHDAEITRFLDSGHTPLFIGYDKKLLAVIMLKDTLRPNAKEALTRLRKYGVQEVIMLTGDGYKQAKEIADSLGIDRFYAELLPTQKAEILETIMGEGKKVAFVGDGINDAPALIKADSGIGMHKGADIAKASADIVLLRDDIEAVADVREYAMQCLAKVHKNFTITVVTNSAILASATFGKLSPIQTAFLHNGTTIFLLLNALRPIILKNKKEKYETQKIRI
ncbi:heavy metal translocating P-type ATPase [uncultured Helicobacter sp.]|mgnify:CR=1 FL=1|uniref:heavy metal translocating P-type ATPase n=1 Tax=uncultured Helicobacter sp. TaxID=175537 RepID=UPI001C3B921D|nr:heavy metal translocating P-type ATPase [Candidatus Helicobacter avicola]